LSGWQRKVVKAELPDAFADLFTPSRYKAFWGGRGGAKSRSFGRALLIKSMQQPLRILCAREVQKSIKDSVKRLLDDDIDRMGLGEFFESTETEIRSRIGGLFIFAGLKTNVDTVKSTEGIDICWCEEANTLSQHSINTLIPTIRKDASELWFSWNPDQESDPVDKMFRGGCPPPDAIVRKVTYEDNPWFPGVLRKELEWDRSRDPEKYAHIWLGDYVKNSEARVFRNWKIDSFDVPKGARPFYGGDWGFAIDPTVLVRCWIVGRTLYIDQEAYEVGCPIDKTPALFDKVEGSRKWPITADSARPETIDYMRRHGFPHIQPARKGPGSLEDGIEFLKSFDIVVHPGAKHAIDELSSYSYKTDKLTGEILPVLDDKKNHVIDAIRYSCEQVRAFDGGTVYATPTEDFLVSGRASY
jgi:phage terminase large subunit